jgi:hypothetical protein
MLVPGCLLAVALATTSCESGDPHMTVPDAADADAPDVPADAPDDVADPDADSPADVRDGTEDGDDDGDVEDVPEVEADAPDPCPPLPGDYRPGADDDWPICVSDDGEYHRIEASISSIARVTQFEQMADLLWRRVTEPTADDFLAARVIYAQEDGLDSRVQRREDLHFPELPAGEGACTDPGVPERFPERCVGPGRMLPILNDAFAAGIAGTEPRVQANRIAGALLWFLYLSSYKEAHTCATTPRDCDSAWAYYTGGEPYPAGLGLARYLRALVPDTHEHVHDGLLAVRCWKNLDNEIGVSTDLALRDRAIAQLDRALLHGLARIAIDRLAALAAAAPAGRAPHAALARILADVLDREATARNPAAAARLRTAIAPADPAEIDTVAAIDALEEIFPCP